MAIVLAAPATAQVSVLPGDNIRIHGDVIAGYFYDDALLPNTSGRERQMQIMRAVLGVSLDISQRWAFLAEYNFVNTEIYRDDQNSARFDWYRNLGLDNTYYGNTNAREIYFTYRVPTRVFGSDIAVRVGRQKTPVGFHPNTLPYWGRIDSPHTTFLAKGLLTGVNIRSNIGGAQADVFYFMGQDHPNRSYNDYNLENDPQVKGNSYPGIAMRLQYDHALGEVQARYHLSGHFDKLGSATGNIKQGKHNDYRAGAGADFKIPLPSWLGFDALELGAEFMRFRTGLTEDGGQGKANVEGTANIYRNGLHGTAALVIGRWSFRYTQEQLDRGDTNILAKVANFDPQHPSMAEVETSQIFSITYAFTDNLEWRLVYRRLENPFPAASGIGEHLGKYRGEDKHLSDLRWRF